MAGRRSVKVSFVKRSKDRCDPGSLLYLLAMIIAAAVDDDTVPVNAVGDP